MSDLTGSEDRDWTEPLRSDSPTSLWEALHDASIQAVVSDRLTREIRIELELGFPEPPEPCPERVSLLFEGVTHALVYTYWNWPGPWPNPSSNPSSKMQSAVDQYYRNSRVETSDLDIFRRWIEDDTDVEVSAAHLHQTTDALTLVLDGTTNDPNSASGWQLRVGAEKLDVTHLDGAPLGLDELLRLGHSGWEAWSKSSNAAES